MGMNFFEGKAIIVARRGPDRVAMLKDPYNEGVEYC